MRAGSPMWCGRIKSACGVSTQSAVGQAGERDLANTADFSFHLSEYASSPSSIYLYHLILQLPAIVIVFKSYPAPLTRASGVSWLASRTDGDFVTSAL